jgi:predicted PurR-regulated permease PerM
MTYKRWSMSARYLVLGLLILLALLGLWYIRSVLKPLIVAAFIAYLISPAASYLTQHTKLSRRASVNIVYIISILLIIGAPASMTSLFFDEFQQIISDILDLIDQLISWLIKPHAFGGLYIDFGQLANQLAQFRTTFLSSLSENALHLLEQTSLGALWILVVMVVVYYLLAEWANLREQMIAFFPADFRQELEELYQHVRAIWMNYLRGQILLMFIVGVVFTIAWTILGIPGALVLGVIAGFFTLVPDVGPFLAAVLAAGVALLEGSSWWPSLPHVIMAVIAMAVYIFLIMIKNFWLRPFIMGRSVHMPEALVFIFIVMATVLWGILGALLVIPVAASLAVIFDYLRRRALGMAPFLDPLSETKTEITAGRSKVRPPHKREKK